MICVNQCLKPLSNTKMAGPQVGQITYLGGPNRATAGPTLGHKHLNLLKTRHFLDITQKITKNDHKTLIKKAHGAVCSQLQDVCTFMRVQDPSSLLPSRLVTKAKGWLPPYAKGLRSSPMRLLLGMALLIPASVSTFENTQWSDSGNFSLSNSSVSSVSWSQPDTDWKAMDAFELSAPSLGPRTNPQIVIGNGSRLDRLFDVIASAEAGSKGYDAIHYSATRKAAQSADGVGDLPVDPRNTSTAPRHRTLPDHPKHVAVSGRG